MEIISHEEIDMKSVGKITECKVVCIHIRVTDIKACAEEMITTISDTSWINKLDTIPKISFEARATRTIEKLVNEILSKVDNEITIEFGEFLISYSAQSVLEQKSLHIKVPLAELLKEKISGNPGFDFHTESSGQYIMFGEAKYSGSGTPKALALNQIAKFIDDKKDDAELILLANFVSKYALEKASRGKKGYVAAFSLNAANANLVFQNALKSPVVEKLLAYQELYLIGIEA